MEELSGKILTGIIIAVLIFILQSAGVHKLIAGIFGGASSPLLESTFTSDSKEEETYWASVEKCGTIECYQLYLNKHPEGKFKDFANMHIKNKMSLINIDLFTAQADILAMIEVNFGEYTKESPLKVFVFPVKPDNKFDAESNIGKIIWKGGSYGLKHSASFSDGRIKPEIIHDANYEKTLRSGFWEELSNGDRKVKDILSSTASYYGVNAIIYGIYDVDDTALKVNFYFYSKDDDIVLKERISMSVPIENLISLRNAFRFGDSLTKKQKSLQKKIHKRNKVATTHLLRKYMEGKN